MAIDIDESNFTEQVLEESLKRPVLIDFWAAWCNPCKVLSPLLEKLEEEYQGRFLLAKIDTQTHQSLAAAYNITGIPHVKMVYKKKITGQFVGAIGENGVRDFLEKHMPDERIEEAARLAAAGETLQALNLIFDANLSGEEVTGILWQSAVLLLQDVAKNKDLIQKCLDKMDKFGPRSDARNSLDSYIKKYGDNDLNLLQDLVTPERTQSTLEKILGEVEKAPSKDKDKFKQKLLTCFFILGDNSAHTQEYRKKLSRALF